MNAAKKVSLALLRAHFVRRRTENVRKNKPDLTLSLVIGAAFLLCLNNAISTAQEPHAGPPSIALHVPSDAAGTEGIAVRVTLPRYPRYPEGAPVVVHVPGGHGPNGLDQPAPMAAFGFIEVRFAFPGGGTGELRSGGRLDFRGERSIRALADVIRYAMGQHEDVKGKSIQEVVGDIPILTENVGLAGWSNGGNACGVVMAHHGMEFPGLAFYASFESPLGEGAVGMELGDHRSGVNPAYDPDTGVLDLSMLAFDPRLRVRTPGEGDPLLGALYFDLNRDDRFAPDRDFELSPLIVDSGSGPKAFYSLRLLKEAQRRDLYEGAKPDHIPESGEATAFWALHDAEPSLKEAVTHCPDVAVVVYGSVRDHVQAAPDHPHILTQVEGFREAGARFVRLNPDRAYVEWATRRSDSRFTDNDAGAGYDHQTIRNALEPEKSASDPDYMIASLCELADRVQAGDFSANLEDVLYPEAPRQVMEPPPGPGPEPPTPSDEAPPQGGVPPSDLYDDTRLIHLCLEFSQPDFYEQLEAHIQDEQDIPATLIAEGERTEEVGVRFKGNSSLKMSGGAKKPFNISMDAFHSGQRLWGYKTLNLNNGFMDPTFVREKIAYDVFRRYIPACKANFVKLFINGRYWGLYTNVQQPNKDFLRAWFTNADGNFYKGDPQEGQMRKGPPDLTWRGRDPSLYEGSYQPKTNEADHDWTDFIHLLDTLNNVPMPQFEQEIQRVLNVDRALWYIALCNLFVNLDSYLGSGHNYYGYVDSDGYFHMIPWDLNEVFGTFNLKLSIANLERLSPFYQQENAHRPLVRKLLSVPSFRARYLAHYRTLLAEVFHEEYLLPEIEKHQNVIRTAAVADMQRLYSMEDFSRNVRENVVLGNRAVPGLLSLVKNRRAYLKTIPELNRSTPTVTSVSHSPLLPTAQDTVWVQARVESERFIRSVTLCIGREKGFIPVAMRDDGRHHDGGEEDGLFGAAIVSHPVSTVQYYILAENDEGTVAFAPARAEHETFTYTLEQTQSSSRPDRIAINEFMASNSQTIADPQDEYDDWIELYNLTDEAIQLGGMYLTDDLNSPRKWSFPDTTLAAHGYLLVWTDGDEGDAPGLHANFRLSADGEQIGLFDTDARGNGVLDTLSFGPQKSDISMGRAPNATGMFGVLSSPTPGAANQSVTAISEETTEAQPRRFRLEQNFPNPFNSGTVIAFSLPKEVEIELEIYNLLGQKVATLVHGEYQAGAYQAHWDGRDEEGRELASGIYLYRLKAGKQVEIRRLVLLR